MKKQRTKRTFGRVCREEAELKKPYPYVSGLALTRVSVLDPSLDLQIRPFSAYRHPMTARRITRYPEVEDRDPEAASTVAGLAEREQPKKHFFDESFYGTPTLITRIGTETGSLVEGTGLRLHRSKLVWTAPIP